MGKPIWACNSGAAITTNGNYCTLIVSYGGSYGVNDPLPALAGQQSSDMIDLASYIFTTGGSTTGTVTFQELAGNSSSGTQNWITLASPAAITIGAATTYSGVINGPFHGLRMVVASLAVSTITYAELKATVRSM